MKQTPYIPQLYVTPPTVTITNAIYEANTYGTVLKLSKYEFEQCGIIIL